MEGGRARDAVTRYLRANLAYISVTMNVGRSAAIGGGFAVAMAAGSAHADGVPGTRASTPAKPQEPRPAARVLTPVATTAAQVAALCARPNVRCAGSAGDAGIAKGLQLYHADGDPPGAAWGILQGAPVLLKIARGANAEWTVEHRWDFSGYAHSHPPTAVGDPDPIAIYPALYPAGPHAWAVALVSSDQEMYSGGGGTFSYADFVLLGDETDANRPTVLYKDVWFSCDKVVRICFTEEDYRARHGDCHAKTTGYLTLDYAPSSVPNRYAWTAVWHPSDDTASARVPLPVGGNASRLFVGKTLCDEPLDDVESPDVK
jgi:hypothetical protein